MNALSIFASFVQAVGLMALLAMSFGSLERSRLGPTARSAVTGLAFGVTGIVAMLAPAVIAPGLIMDGRAIIVGLGAAFGGPIAAIIGALVAGTFRAFVIGGPGTVPGVAGIFIAAAIGLAWMRLIVRDGRPTLFQLALGGFLISLHFAAIFFLPLALAADMMMTIYPMLLVMAMLGTLALGLLVERERRLIDIQNKLARAALIDPLTGLPNRRHFEETFARIGGSAAAEEGRSTFVLLDIDRFKAVNDSHGHAAGDEALRSFAATLVNGSTNGGIAARMGGEEFAMLFNGLTASETLDRLERLLDEVRSTPIQYGGAVFHITASAGLTEFDPATEDSSAVLRRADEALYAAKTAGRDRYTVASLAAAA